VRTLALAAGLAAAISCAAASGAPESQARPELGKPFTLAAGESASLDSGKISVRFVAIGEDSRCPKNEQCVWAGNARVELEVRTNGSPQSISLNTNKGAAEREIDGYFVSLQDVAPAPISGRAIAPQDYRVTLTVGRGASSQRPTDAPVR
jgi:hypothetical protein